MPCCGPVLLQLREQSFLLFTCYQEVKPDGPCPHSRLEARFGKQRRLGKGLKETLQSPQVGRLWTALADYFIRQGMFEKARDVYEEGLTTVITVRDFSLIFDALTTFETSLLEARLAVRSAVMCKSVAAQRTRYAWAHWAYSFASCRHTMRPLSR